MRFGARAPSTHAKRPFGVSRGGARLSRILGAAAAPLIDPHCSLRMVANRAHDSGAFPAHLAAGLCPPSDVVPDTGTGERLMSDITLAVGDGARRMTYAELA